MQQRAPAAMFSSQTLSKCTSSSRGHHARILNSHQRRRCRKTQFFLRCSPPHFNPQNVDEAKVRPGTELSAEEAVSLQLEALQCTHEPWTNHGIQVMYDFCEGSGSMERSRYFGYSKDLYHFDHFLGGFQNEFPDLVDNKGFTIEKVGKNEQGEQTVDVVVQCQKANAYEQKFTFCLVEREFGTKKGCLMTSRIIKH